MVKAPGCDPGNLGSNPGPSSKLTKEEKWTVTAKRTGDGDT